MSENDLYQNPLASRYASREMASLWSDRTKFTTWRQLWVALAEVERELGLPISADQIDALRKAQDEIDFAKAREYERRFRHDVMAHVHAYGDVAPAARSIIHLGATSCYVTDNADLIIMRQGLDLLRRALLTVMRHLSAFAQTHRDLPTLGFTHFQPAQLTTVGKRSCLWLYDLVLDLEELDHRQKTLAFRGAKGTTGTQASFFALFDGDHSKVRELDRRIANRFGFARNAPVTGQTYSRKLDAQVVDILSGICQSAHKFAVDLRLLAHRKEVEEPFEAEQIGSSAMAYKRNPMRAERMCGIARFVISLAANPAYTETMQWLERTLDDSANRRLVLPQAFLGTDAVLRLYANVASGLVVYPGTIRRAVEAELPFMATENILMAAVRAGGDRQELHERIRRHSLAAAERVKRDGAANDLIDRLRSDPAFQGVEWDRTLDPAGYTGRAAQQVDEFLGEVVQPILDGAAQVPAVDTGIDV
jgi:adenylosuccinate lyase